jgi:hypothetical protein
MLCLSARQICRCILFTMDPQPKRRKGGIRQRLKQEKLEENRDAAPLESSLVCLLILLWSWGTLSPQMLQKIAHKAHADVCQLNARNKSKLREHVEFDEFEDLRLLAGIGCEGVFSNNCHRDLQSCSYGRSLLDWGGSLFRFWIFAIFG